MKTSISVVLLLITLVVGVGFVRRHKSARSSKVQLNVKDLQEEGLTLISPENSQYDEELSTISQGDNAYFLARLESVRHLTSFIKNGSNLNLVAYSIKWEIVRADGSSITQYDSYAEPGPFMGTNRLSNAQAEERKGMTVHPNKAHLISWAGVVDEDLNGDAGSGSTSNAATEQGEASLIDILKTELAQASSVTVSLDCAIFDDGSCVGPDTGGYFNQLYAQIKAKKDLLRGCQMNCVNEFPSKVGTLPS